MRNKTIIFLLFLNAIVFGAIYMLQRADDAQMLESKIFMSLGVDLSKIDKIEISGDRVHASRTLSYTTNGWMLEAPYLWRANPYAIQQLLVQLKMLSKDASFSRQDIEKAGQHLSDYGLGQPSLKLTLFEEDTPFVFYVGASTQMGERVYCLCPDGQTIIAANKKFLSAVTMHLEDLRSSIIFESNPFEVEALTIKGNDTGTTILSRQEDRWRLEAPIEVRADSALTGVVINNMLSLEVDYFLDDQDTSLVTLGLDAPLMRLTLVSDNKQETLRLGNKVSLEEDSIQYYAKKDGVDTLFVLSLDMFSELSNARSYLRDKYAMDFKLEDVTKLVFAMQENSIILQKLENKTWEVIEYREGERDSSKKADSQVVQNTIELLKDIRIEHFVTDAVSESQVSEYGLDKPQREIKIYTTEGKKYTFLLGDYIASSKHLYAKHLELPFVYEVQSRLLNELQLNARHYLDRSFSVIPASAQVSSLVLRSMSEEDPIFDMSYDAQLNEWTSKGEPLTGSKQSAFEILLYWAKHPKAKDYLNQEFSDTYTIERGTEVPWSLVLSLGFQSNDMEQIRSFHFTERLGGDFQVGGFADYNISYSIPRDVMDALFALSFKRELAQGYDELKDKVQEDQKAANGI